MNRPTIAQVTEIVSQFRPRDEKVAASVDELRDRRLFRGRDRGRAGRRRAKLFGVLTEDPDDRSDRAVCCLR